MQVVDIHDVINGDLSRIALFVLGGILLVLVVLVRALVAPIYLLVTVLLSLGATVGATTLVFQGLDGQSGLVFWVPFLILTMLVGLSTDYNILVISRVREETTRLGNEREAVATAVAAYRWDHHYLRVGAGRLLRHADAWQRYRYPRAWFRRRFRRASRYDVASYLLVPALVVLFGQYSWFPQRRVRAITPFRQPVARAS